MDKRSVHGAAIKLGENFLCLLLVGTLLLSLSACVGTPKASNWSATKGLSTEEAFNASVRAVADLGFTIVSSDRSAGVISARKETYGGNAAAEHRMSIQVRKASDTVAVTTRVFSSDVGIIPGAMGGAVNAEITNNFYVYLFRQLGISDPSQRQVTIGDTQ